MAGVIKINPAVFQDDRDAHAVAWDEALRLFMEDTGFEPKFDVTPEQLEFFKDTAYADGGGTSAEKGGDVLLGKLNPKKWGTRESSLYSGRPEAASIAPRVSSSSTGYLGTLVKYREEIKEAEESDEARATALFSKVKTSPLRAAVENLVLNTDNKRTSALASASVLAMPVVGPAAIAHRGAISAAGALVAGASPLVDAADAYAVRIGTATPGQIANVERIVKTAESGTTDKVIGAVKGSWHAPFTSDVAKASGKVGIISDAAQAVGNYTLSQELDRLAGVEPPRVPLRPFVDLAVSGIAKGLNWSKYDKTIGFSGEALGNVATSTRPLSAEQAAEIRKTLDIAKRALVAESKTRKHQ